MSQLHKNIKTVRNELYDEDTNKPNTLAKKKDFKEDEESTIFNEIDYRYQKSISYSQLSTHMACPHKWSLMYRDGHKIPSFSINTVFGTAIHNTIQIGRAHV